MCSRFGVQYVVFTILCSLLCFHYCVFTILCFILKVNSISSVFERQIGSISSGPSFPATVSHKCKCKCKLSTTPQACHLFPNKGQHSICVLKKKTAAKPNFLNQVPPKSTKSESIAPSCAAQFEHNALLYNGLVGMRKAYMWKNCCF